MPRWRFLVAATIVLIGGVGVALAATQPPDRTAPPEGRTTPTPEPSPTATPEPETAEETDRPPTKDRPDSEAKTERHVIHGSGNIGVISGNVEQGETASGTSSKYIGPSPRPPASAP
jgi:hypothetical protein